MSFRVFIGKADGVKGGLAMSFFWKLVRGFEAALLRLIPSWLHPNVFTVVRALLVVPVVIWKSDAFISASLVAVSSVLDILDGWLARKRGLVSKWGKVLDPVSDKIFTLGVLVFACWDLIDVRLGVAIIIGEVLLTLVRPLQMRLKVDPAASGWGSAKTWAQAIGMGFVLSQIRGLFVLSQAAFVVAVLLAGISLFGHVRRFFVRPSVAHS